MTISTVNGSDTPINGVAPFTAPKRDLDTKDNEHESDSKKPKTSANKRVFLNPVDCNLDFNIESDGLQGSDLHDWGFAYCWSGSRANVGIAEGKYCFSCKVISTQPVEMKDIPADEQHACLVGISRGDCIADGLGEDRNSFAFGGIGKYYKAGKFSDCGFRVGLTFEVGDTIVCAVDLTGGRVGSVKFFKNGEWARFGKLFDAGPTGLGLFDTPKKRDKKGLPWESAVFPHVLLRNAVVQMQFSVEDGLVPIDGYKPWDSALDDGKAITGPVATDVKDCEVVMMVGLPAAGKTRWQFYNRVKKFPAKRFVTLGNELVKRQMKDTSPRKLAEHFDNLTDTTKKMVSILVSRAAKIPRNYVIDQNNLNKYERKYVLRPFADFHKTAVVVFNKPMGVTHAELKLLKSLHIPVGVDKTILACPSQFTSFDIPEADEDFDEVHFPLFGRAESKLYWEQQMIKRASLNKSGDLPDPDRALARSMERRALAIDFSKLIERSIPISPVDLNS